MKIILLNAENEENEVVLNKVSIHELPRFIAACFTFEPALMVAVSQLTCIAAFYMTFPVCFSVLLFDYMGYFQEFRC